MRRISRLTVLFVVFCITASIAYTSYAQDILIPATNPELITKPHNTDTVMTMELKPTYYETLNDTDKELYNIIGTLVTTYADSQKLVFLESNIEVTSETSSHIVEVALKYLYDHPAYGSFWNGKLNVKNNKELALSIIDTPDCMLPDSYYKEKLASYDIAPVSDYYLAYHIFLNLQEKIEYDWDKGNNPDNKHWNDDYGALIQKKACCQGLSFAYKRMLDAANIPCVILTCYTVMNEYHMINAIFVDGSWKFCDLTGACCYPRNKDSYFCMTTDDFNIVANEIKYIPE